MASSLGASGISLYPGQWEAGVSYRYLQSDDVYVGTEQRPEIKQAGVEPRHHMHSTDLSFRYGISSRASAAALVPFILSYHSVIHADGQRHDFAPRIRLGDLRFVGNLWLLDPLEHARGNIGLGVGVKIPTGSAGATGTYYTPAGPEKRTLDISQQPGDGGWALLLEWQGFRSVYRGLTAFTSGYYMFSPRNTNGVEPPQSIASPDEPFFMSVPDQFSLRAGLHLPVFPRSGLSASLAGRWDGQPVTDVFGGSDGFRRPGSVVFVEPGVNWTFPANTIQPSGNAFFLSVPIAVRREIKTSRLDESRGVVTGGGLADFLIFAGFTRRF